MESTELDGGTTVITRRRRARTQARTTAPGRPGRGRTADGLEARAPEPTPEMAIAAAVTDGYGERFAAGTAKQTGESSWLVDVEGIPVVVQILGSGLPALRLFVPIRPLPSSTLLLATINEVNANLSFARALHVEGSLILAMELVGHGLAGEQVAAATDFLAATAADVYVRVERVIPLEDGPSSEVLLN